MANFFTNKQFQGVFPADFATGISFKNLTTTSERTIRGILYDKAVAVEYLSSDGTKWKATFGGAADLVLTTISFPPFGEIPTGISGTVKAYLQEEFVSGAYKQAWGVSGTSANAAEIYNLLKTPNAAAIEQFVAGIFSGNDNITLSRFDDPAGMGMPIRGYDGNDIMRGGKGNDKMNGDAGKDRLEGGLGKDTLTGGTGADRFVYVSIDDSKPGSARDLLTDFSGRLGDRIDLTAIDARPSTTNTNEAFAFIGGAGFNTALPPNTVGEVRFVASGTGGLVQVNLPGTNATPEMEIFLRGVTAFSQTYLLL